MERLTQKISTILIATGGKMRVYRSLAHVPPGLRKKLTESTSGSKAATLLIADEGGRKEILRSLRGLPTALESRLLDTLAVRPRRSASRRLLLGLGVQQWAEIGFIGLISLLLWLLAGWK